MNIINDINNIKIEKELTEIRRYLHENPELSLQEYNSQKYIVNKLKEFGLTEIYDDIYKTAVLAIIRGKEEGKTVLIRADMDALPINEQNNLSFCSKNSGVMHACGHDAHMTWGLGTAYILNKLKDHIKGNIKILFQPAEEGDGGADILLETNDILSSEPKVDYALAGHCWPSIKAGDLAIVDGCAMAAANKFTLEIHGKGGHGAEPHKTIDPISLANQAYMAIQHIRSRQLSPFNHSVVTIGVFKGIGAFNVIPDSVIMEGTVRADSYTEVKAIMTSIDKVVAGIVESQSGTYSITVEKPIEAVINDSELVKKSYDILKEITNIDILKVGAMTGEDFCYISNRVPSVYMYVGTSSSLEIKNPPLHNPKFNIDEGILEPTSKKLSYLALKLLEDN